MGPFIRNNLMIVASIALPLLIVALFALANVIPRWLTEPPTFGFIVLSQTNSREIRAPVELRIDASQGQLRARVFSLENNTNTYSNQGYLPRVFEYMPGETLLHEIRYELPDNAESLQDGAELDLANITGRAIVTTDQAPDGYIYDRNYNRGGRGLFSELFGGGYRDSSIRLQKDGASVPIRLPSDIAPYGYYNLQYLGWLDQ